jgi:hypothetical protein
MSTETNAVIHQPSLPCEQTASSGRDPKTGRFVVGNEARLMHGAHRRHPAALQASLRREIEQEVLSNLGLVNGDAPATLRGLVERYAEVSLMCSSYIDWLAREGGPISTKGRQKAAVKGYLAALDRQMALAKLIGLERKAKRVSLIDAMTGDDDV